MNYSDKKFLEELLVCPTCKEDLDFSSDTISCFSCGQQFSRLAEDCFDLLPEQLLRNDKSRWNERQQEMEKWYQSLITDPKCATYTFTCDLAPYEPFLAALSGTVLDLGGGNGVIRHYLPREVQYIVLDPCLDWLESEWKSIATHFPCLKTRPSFVRGVGEYLPFPAQSFDVVLTFWTLNHVSQPKQVFQEVNRVLRPGGLFLAILEDMEPSWLDLLGRRFPTRDRHHFKDIFTVKLWCSFPGQEWPIQSDHIRIQESDLRAWSSCHFEVTRRAWIGQYLTYEFRKLESMATP